MAVIMVTITICNLSTSMFPCGHCLSAKDKRLIPDGHEVATADQQVDADSLFGEFPPQGPGGFADFFWASADDWNERNN